MSRATDLEKLIWGFPKIRGTFLGVPIIRTIVFWGLYCTAQADTLGVASEPSRKRAMAEHGKLESAQDAGGGRLVDVTPLSELGQAVKAPPVKPAHATTAERTDAATASTNTAVAGPQPKTSAAGIPPGGPAGVDEDEYTSESTEEVPKPQTPSP